ncbi:MAG: type II toxin-antitoxin system RelE/ParE family toxin [Tenacibaculum sp.]|nr:type II toxin-antitoxin system RelE/ParE family toxin [Tenacibaculum sp.]
MYEVVWTPRAEMSYISTLEYWINKNKSNSYSLKIANEVIREEQELKKDPFFLAKYENHLKLYRKIFFGGKFIFYYRIDIDNKKIILRYFRSTKQKLL